MFEGLKNSGELCTEMNAPQIILDICKKIFGVNLKLKRGRFVGVIPNYLLCDERRHTALIRAIKPFTTQIEESYDSYKDTVYIFIS